MKTKQLFRWLLFATMVLLVPIGASAQVTIGSGNLPSAQSLLDLDASVVQKGLHLPRLDSVARNQLTSSEKTLTQGLAIYNTDTRCFEYWNQMKWVSLCTGAADIRLDKPAGALIGQPDQYHAWDDDNEHGPIVPIETPEPACGIASPFSVTVISGSTFLSLNVIDSSTGVFTYTLSTNNSYNSRTAVVRITSNCTQEYKDFLVNQEGNTAVCAGTAGTPVISILGSSSSTAGVVCQGGQTVLSVANAASLTVVNNPDDFVWARNGIEVGRGLTFYTNQAGNYQVFLGGVGCPNHSGTAVITFSNVQAPRPVVAIDADNSGMICNGQAIELDAVTHPEYAAPEVVQWLLNGDPNITGLTVSGVTNVGDMWSAVVINPVTGCVSKTSNELLTREGSGSQPSLTASGILINGATMSSNPALCPGSTIRLEVGTPDPNLTYEWTVNSSGIGMGSIVFYDIPADKDQLIIQCIAAGTGCITSVTLNSQLSVAKPARPIINSSSSFVCASSTLTLSTDLQAGVTYQWFRNGSPIAGQTSSTLTINNAGSFEVQASIGACQSDRSPVRDIALSGAPTSVVFSVAPSVGIPDNTIPFLATGVNAESWTWSTDGKISESGNGAAEYSWATEGVKTVTATARNACGTTPVSTQITIQYLQMAQPTVVPVAAAACGGGAQYKVDLSSYADIDILTGFVWTVTRAGVSIPFQTLGDRGSIIQFEYTAPGSATYSVSAVAIGVGKVNSAPSAAQTITPASPTTINARLRGLQLFDVARTGSDIAQRQANITAGGTYPYSIYNGGTSQTSGASTFSFPVFAGATYLWAVDDPDGLLSNANVINGATTVNINLAFGDAVNSITNGQVRTIMLSCIVTIGGCNYPLIFPIRVQDRFACGTGGFTTKLMGTTVAYGQRTSQRSYDTYTFPTSTTDQTPKCWMIEDSAEGTNASTSSGCRNGNYARQTNNGRGFHYRSDNVEKRSACPDGWRLPVGATSGNGNGSEIGLHFTNLQAWPEYKAMWFLNFTVQHGYDCTATYGSWQIWMLNGTGSNDHEAWINRTTTAMQANGDNSHNSFSARCVKDNY